MDFHSMHDYSNNMLSHDIAVSQSIQMQHQLDVQQANAALQQGEYVLHDGPLTTVDKLWAILTALFGLLRG